MTLKNEIKILWKRKDGAHRDSEGEFLLHAQGSLVGKGRGGERVLLRTER